MRKHLNKSSLSPWTPKRTGSLQAILIALIVFGVAVASVFLQIEAYGGDVSCLVVRCVKVKP